MTGRDRKRRSPGPGSPAGRHQGGPAGPQGLGSEAFGGDPHGRPTGAKAFGGGEPEAPLKGALLFGNDPQGGPTGADAFGGSEPEAPLKGALLFGNDPQGGPTGADAFGGGEAAFKLKGALLFGNDPEGGPTGADAFGGADAAFVHRGAGAFGAPQLIPERLRKDDLGYDFGGVLLQEDEASMAGIRKSPLDRLRLRVLRVLERQLGCEAERLRHGLGENAIPWRRLRRDAALDLKLAETLRRWWRKAPGEVLGIDQAREVLERLDYMHSFALLCEWDATPVQLAVVRGDDTVAWARSVLHKEHSFFAFETPDNQLLAYADAIQPQRHCQVSRIRGAEAQAYATFSIEEPAPWPNVEDAAGISAAPPGRGAPAERSASSAGGGGGPQRFKGVLRDAHDEPVFELQEQRAAPTLFKAVLTRPGGGEEIGRIEDRLSGGKIRSQIEVDVKIPRVVVWAVAAVVADLARLRRKGWPHAPEPGAREHEAVEPIDAALGPRRRRS